MMKKLLLLLLILLFISMNLGAATYYMRADGTAANKAAASGPCGTQANCMTIATHDVDTFSAGDIITFCDDGGNYEGVRLDPPSSGTDGNPIIYRKYVGDTPVITVKGDIPGWGTSGNWTATYGSNLVTDGGFVAVSTTGSELLTNGNMEADANWDDYLGPTTNERSGEQVHGDTYSRKMTAGGSGTGIKNDTVSATTTGKSYKINWWTYPADQTSVLSSWANGDASWNYQDIVESGLDIDSWNEMTAYVTEVSGGTGNGIVLQAKFAGTWYYDDVSVKEITFDSWTEGTGWAPETDSRTLTGKVAKVAGTGSNLEQTGLNATASTTYQITYTVTNRTAGAIYVEFGSTNGTSRTTDNTFVQEITASDTDHLKFVADASFDGTIDTVIVQVQGSPWYIQSISADPYRVWFDGTEAMQAETDETNIDSSHKWYYDSASDYLHVFAAQNPANEYSDIDGAVSDPTNPTAMRIQNKSYLTFEGIHFEGGGYTISVEAVTANVTKIYFDTCTIGKNSGRWGLQTASFNDSYVITYGEIYDSTFESNNTINYDYDPGAEDSPGYAIVFSNGTQNWKVYRNTLSNWQHSIILIEQNDADRSTEYNEIYKNSFSNANIDYGRCLAVTGYASNNKFYGNYVEDTKLFINLGGQSNEFTYNIIDTVTNPSWDSTGKAYGIVVRPVSADSDNHKVYNNVIYNTEEPCIVVSDAGEAQTVENNEIINNILMNCSTNSNGGFSDGIALMVDDSIAGNIYRNNLMYKVGVSDYINYRGSDMTITEFLAANGTSGDTILDNINSDPLLLDLADGNFRLSPDSPCANTGTSTPYALALDPDDDTFPYDTIGQTEFDDKWDIGAFRVVGSKHSWAVKIKNFFMRFGLGFSLEPYQ